MQNFLLLFMSLLIPHFLKKGHIIGYNLLYPSEKRTKTNLKLFQYQIQTSVKRSEKQLPSKANFCFFFLLNCSNFKLKQCKRHRVTKILKQIMFQGVWGESESKTGFQRQSVTKYWRLTLVSTQNSTLREKFNFYFSRVFCQN